MAREVVIVDGVRTPLGRFGGSLKNVSMVDLGAIVIKALVDRNKLCKSLIDQVIMGNVIPNGDQGGNPARTASLRAGLSVDIPAWTVNINCASGLQAINVAAQIIKNGDADIIIAGGMESMTNASFQSNDTRWGAKLKHSNLYDSILLGLYEPVSAMRMDETAEKVAKMYGVSREEQDQYAAASHNRAEKAIKEGKFKDEVVPVEIDPRKKTFFDTDEHVRLGMTYEEMAKLKPAFSKDGTVTAGNASGINDAGSGVLLMTKERASELGLKPLGKIISYAVAGVDPSVMGMGPVASTRKALKKINMELSQIDLIECNEAFAAQVLAVEREMKWDRSKVNVNGGAIALGHPVSATGPRLLITLLYEMRRQNLRYGLATLCVGGGHGVATVVERD